MESDETPGVRIPAAWPLNHHHHHHPHQTADEVPPHQPSRRRVWQVYRAFHVPSPKGRTELSRTEHKCERPRPLPIPAECSRPRPEGAGCQSRKARAARTPPPASPVLSALPGPPPARQSRGPPPRGSRAGAAATARRAAPQQPRGQDGGRTESAQRRETVLSVSAPPPGRPSPSPEPGHAARGIVGDVVPPCGEAASAFSRGAQGDAVAWQPRGAAAATALEKTQHPDHH